MSDAQSRTDKILHLHAIAVDPSRNLLSCGAATVTLEPKVMDVLCSLLERPGAVISRQDLLRGVWGDIPASDESLTRAISQLRRAFQKVDSSRDYIETVAKRGYCITTAPGSETALSARVAPPAAAAQDRTSIAVLAFDDMSEASDQAYFADGVAEEIIHALVRAPYLRVIGRTSSFAFREASETITSIAAALGVTHILQGSVRKHRDRLRISAQLVEAASDLTVWSETFDGEADDIFDLQQNIAMAVATSLKARFEGDVSALRLAGRLTASAEAYDLFVRGRSLTTQIFGNGVLQQGAACLERAVMLDPNFAEAWAELANCYAEVAGYTPRVDARGTMSRCAAAAERAIELNPACGLSRAMLAQCALSNNNPAEAIGLALEGVRLEPENPDVLLRAGYCLAVIGRTNDALPHLLKAVALDPLQGRNHFVLSLTYMNKGDFEAAEKHAQRAIDAQYHGAIYAYGQAAYARGEYDLAVERVATLATTFDFFTGVFWPEYVTPELWRISALGWFSGKAEHRDLLLQGVSMVAQNSANKDDLTLIINFMMTGAAPDMFKFYSPRPGANIVLLSLWHALEPTCRIRRHADFPAFAERIGLKAAWDIYGRPDCMGANS